jgi:hypothetical protein
MPCLTGTLKLMRSPRVLPERLEEGHVLSVVDGAHLLDGLEFENDLAVGQNVGSIVHFDLQSFINARLWLLWILKAASTTSFAR